MLLNPKFIEALQRFDPLLDLLYNPRIQRWVVVQDLRRSARPNELRRTNRDLVGVSGVSPERCPYVRLFRLEDQGIPIVPNVEWIIRELSLRSHDSRDDGAFADVMAQDARSDAEQRRQIRNWATEDGEYRFALLKRRTWSYPGQPSRAGRC